MILCSHSSLSPVHSFTFLFIRTLSFSFLLHVLSIPLTSFSSVRFLPSIFFFMPFHSFTHLLIHSVSLLLFSFLLSFLFIWIWKKRTKALYTTKERKEGEAEMQRNAGQKGRKTERIHLEQEKKRKKDSSSWTRSYPSPASGLYLLLIPSGLFLSSPSTVSSPALKSVPRSSVISLPLSSWGQ